MRNKTSFLVFHYIVLVFFLGIATSCEKENDEDNKNTSVNAFFNSKWIRTDENTGMYIDLTGEYPVFCSSSDWTQFDFSKIVGVNSNTIEFTITNPANGGYYTLRCIKTDEFSMQLVTHKTSYANDFTAGYYTQTDDWCDNTDQDDRFGSFTDPRDGNVYKTVKIGNQDWLAENLKYLPSVTVPGGAYFTGSTSEPLYYVNGYEGTDVVEAKGQANYTTYGSLYNWSAAMEACPAGWHLPSLDEWYDLINYLGGKYYAGGKIKATILWDSPNAGASDEVGFSALPGGSRGTSGHFNGIGFIGYWWSATGTSTNNARYLSLSNENSYINQTDIAGRKDAGLSVRCLRD